MKRLRFRTAGESHGRGLLALLEGLPAGLELVTARDVDPELKRRQGGYGRGRRMKIESDRVEVLSGIRLGETLGSPLAFIIWNRDWENWTQAMAHEPPPEGVNPKALRSMYLPRPGHADLVGVLKFDRRDTRDILERASARETAARVACGAVAKRFLAEFGIRIGSHVVSVGHVQARIPEDLPEDLNSAVDENPLRCLDPEATEEMMEAIDKAGASGDTLGGIGGVPPDVALLPQCIAPLLLEEPLRGLGEPRRQVPLGAEGELRKPVVEPDQHRLAYVLALQEGPVVGGEALPGGLESHSQCELVQPLPGQLVSLPRAAEQVRERVFAHARIIFPRPVPCTDERPRRCRKPELRAASSC